LSAEERQGIGQSPVLDPGEFGEFVPLPLVPVDDVPNFVPLSEQEVGYQSPVASPIRLARWTEEL